MHYLAAGAGQPMVVFESGGGGGVSMSDLPVLRLVSAFTRGCIYDRAGLGWSDPGPSGRSFEDRADDLHALLAAAGEAAPYVLVGSSFGGLGARAFCRRYPEEVVGMVLVDAAEEQHYFDTLPSTRGQLEEELRAEALRAATGELRMDLERRLRRADAFSEADKVAILDLFSRPDHFEAALEELSAVDSTPAEMRGAGGFGRLGDRPLIVLGRGKALGGPMAPWEEGAVASQLRLASLSTASAYFVARVAGHSIGLERPALVAAAIAAVVNAARGNPLDVGEVDPLSIG
jgi:pimeloyl-ACP methyl ester carboxylesterase